MYLEHSAEILELRKDRSVSLFNSRPNKRPRRDRDGGTNERTRRVPRSRPTKRPQPAPNSNGQNDMAMSTYLTTKHPAGAQPLDKMKICPSVETFTMKKSDFGRLSIALLHLRGQFIDKKWAFRSIPMLVLPYTQFITITRVSLWEDHFRRTFL